jgi:hypothetical protein
VFASSRDADSRKCAGRREHRLLRLKIERVQLWPADLACAAMASF